MIFPSSQQGIHMVICLQRAGDPKIRILTDTMLYDTYIFFITGSILFMHVYVLVGRDIFGELVIMAVVYYLEK